MLRKSKLDVKLHGIFCRIWDLVVVVVVVVVVAGDKSRFVSGRYWMTS